MSKQLWNRLGSIALLGAFIAMVGCSRATTHPVPVVKDQDQTQTDRMLSADKALEIARASNANASEHPIKWQVPVYLPGFTVDQSGAADNRKVWEITGIYPSGQQLVIMIDAFTGDVLNTLTKPVASQPGAQPGPGAPKISREKLLATIATASSAEFKSMAMYEFPLRNPDRWVAIYVVFLRNKTDQRPAGSLTIDAFTGEVLTITGPPGGS